MAKLNFSERMALLALGEKLKAARKKLRLSVTEAATDIGISQPNLSNLERGKSIVGKKMAIDFYTSRGFDKSYFLDLPNDPEKERMKIELEELKKINQELEKTINALKRILNE